MALNGALCAVACPSAGAQSLALSYKLAPAASPAEQAVIPAVDRCVGLSWVASLTAACVSNYVSRAATRLHESGVTVVPAGQSVSEAAVQPKSEVAEVPADEEPLTYSGVQLPALASGTTDTRVLRALPKDTLEPGKSFDVLFRFASKYRLRNGDEGWEVWKFKDVTSENRTQTTGLKGVAVELYVPFH